MSELRKNIIDKIYEEVSDTHFGIDNFSTTFPTNSSTLVKIVFLADPSYTFLIQESYDEDIITQESPGSFKNTTEYSGLSMEKAIRRIRAWSQRLRSELSSSGIKEEETDEIFTKIDEYVDTLEEPNKKFTNNEIEELKEKLHGLENKFDDLLEKNIINENELKTLKQQLNGAEQDLLNFSKKIWYKTSMRNVIGKTKSILTSKEGREVALGLVKKLIGLD